MLSRYEELIIKKEIFMIDSQHIYRLQKNGFLDRPLIDEYIIVLKKDFSFAPDLKFKKNDFKMYLSHDVDEPSRYGFKNNFRIF